jgi:hypothetical protein
MIDPEPVTHRVITAQDKGGGGSQPGASESPGLQEGILGDMRKRLTGYAKWKKMCIL